MYKIKSRPILRAHQHILINIHQLCKYFVFCNNLRKISHGNCVKQGRVWAGTFQTRNSSYLQSWPQHWAVGKCNLPLPKATIVGRHGPYTMNFIFIFTHHISWLNDTETKECQKEESPLSFSSPSGRWEQQIPPGGEGTEGFTLLLSLFPTCPFLFPNPTQFWEREEKAVPILQLYIIQHVCFMSRLTLPWVRWAILILFPHTAFKFGCLWFKREESNEGKSIIEKESMK